MYLIMRSSGSYDDYSEDPLYLVESREDADEICEFFNELVEVKKALDEELNDYMVKWKKENTYDYNSLFNDRDRIYKIKNLLKENFKEEQKEKLREELSTLNSKQQEWKEWVDKESQACIEFKNKQQWPSKFEHIKESWVSPDASYSYEEINLSTKEEVLGP